MIGMKRNLYLNKNGRLHRKENTIFYYTDEGRKIVPIDQVKAVYAVGRISTTSGVMSYFSQKGIPIHFFGYYGHYEGSYYPKRRLISGYTVVNQASCYLDNSRRTRIASGIVQGCISNMIVLLDSRSDAVDLIGDDLSELAFLLDEAQSISSVPELMSVEGRAWIHFYGALDLLVKNFDMGPRVKRPPNNPLNAMISFGNSLLYTAVLSQIYHTQLDPSISFLHEPMERRFSLALDVSEVFKPVLVARLILRLLNLNIIQKEHFDEDLNSCVLTEVGRTMFLAKFDDLLRKTYRHPRLKRSVSNEYRLRLECYKIQKHVTEKKRYSPFVAEK